MDIQIGGRDDACTPLGVTEVRVAFQPRPSFRVMSQSEVSFSLVNRQFPPPPQSCSVLKAQKSNWSSQVQKILNDEKSLK